MQRLDELLNDCAAKSRLDDRMEEVRKQSRSLDLHFADAVNEEDRRSEAA